MTRAVAIVPARLGSRRLPRKMLLDETGSCLFEHTVQNARRCASLEQVVVATDSEELVLRAEAAGIQAVLTRADHVSGTDRVFEALTTLEASGGPRASWDVVINVQGDEPELDPADLGRLIAAFDDPAVEMATLSGPLLGEAELRAPQVVKVVTDRRGDALYFSRSPIPYAPGATQAAFRRAEAEGDGPGEAPDGLPDHPGLPGLPGPARRHVGVYAFRPSALAEFCELGPGVLEQCENLEQLRWLEAGKLLRVVESSHVPLGIDTRADYDAFVERIAAAGGPGSGVDQAGSQAGA